MLCTHRDCFRNFQRSRHYAAVVWAKRALLVQKTNGEVEGTQRGRAIMLAVEGMLRDWVLAVRRDYQPNPCETMHQSFVRAVHAFPAE